MAEHARRWGFVDWGYQSHSACVVDEDGKAVTEFKVDNTPEGMADLVSRFTRACVGDRGSLLVGIETQQCPAVDALLDAGFSLFTLNPKQIDRFRDRYSPAGAKDDARDGFVGANALRTDPDAFHRIEPDPPAVMTLREWTRADQELGEDLVALSNRLWAQVMRVAPHWLKLCEAANEPWFWSLLELAPTPLAAATLTAKQVGLVLRHHRIRRVHEAEVLRVWRTPCPGITPAVQQAVAARIVTLLPRLRVVHEERDMALAQIKRCLEACKPELSDGTNRPDDVSILLSQPGIGDRVAAGLIAEAGRCLRERNLQAFRAQSGTCPVTKSSGKSRRVVMRRACQRRLRDVCFWWSRSAIVQDPHCKEHYAALRRRGHSRARCYRTLADRNVSRLFTMLERRTLYDPNYRRIQSGDKRG